MLDEKDEPKDEEVLGSCFFEQAKEKEIKAKKTLVKEVNVKIEPAATWKLKTGDNNKQTVITIDIGDSPSPPKKQPVASGEAASSSIMGQGACPAAANKEEIDKAKNPLDDSQPDLGYEEEELTQRALNDA
eukprot:949488-Heterocapsa_arctica.AAC.1